MHAPSRFAVVDIGSNTAKLSVYACTHHDGPTLLLTDADTVRIGYRVTETGVIAPDRLDRLIDCLTRYERAARELNATSFMGVATQAFRIASNSAGAVARIERETSWTVRVIGADEETELTIEGARPWLVAGQENLVADIGGASTEVIAVAPDGAIVSSGSVRVGSGLLYDEEIQSSPPPTGSLDRARERALAAFDGAGVLPPESANLLLPGGTGQYLERLLSTLTPSATLKPDGLEAVHDWLASRHALETMERIPVQLDRAHVLPASLAIVEALVLRLCPTNILAVPSGIRDGIAHRVCPPA
jgi:exopolyphosphatase / guanosine-5'-triphosphate,3'-diphosphate pyrophosphatase